MGKRKEKKRGENEEKRGGGQCRAATIMTMLTVTVIIIDGVRIKNYFIPLYQF